MRRYSAVGKRVHDAGGQVLADCKSAAVARKIADALNAAAPAAGGSGSVLVRRDRMKGVQVEWPAAPLIDEPRSRTKRQEEERMLAKLRTDFDRRVESLLRPGTGKKLRAAIKRKRFVAEAEREVKETGKAYDVPYVFEYIKSKGRRPRRTASKKRKRSKR